MRTTRPSRATTRPPGRGLLVGLLAVALLGLPGLLTTAGATETASGGNGEMVLVLDASGSMKEPHGDGRSRFKAAQAALREVVTSLPGDLDVGLRVYGSRISDGPGSCEDSELVVPVGPLDRPALRQALGKARPLGNTPIAYSLREAAKDLSDKGPRTIVLVSDGEESCNGDPCKVARGLSQQGLDLHVDVVGFQVDDAARNQLTCVAQAGRGTFYDAPDADALVNQLSRLSARAARSYRPSGIPVEGTDDADGAPTLAPGSYLDTIGDGAETETYLVDPAEGSSLHLSATDRPTTVSLSDSEQLELLVSTRDGQVCTQARGTGMGAFDRQAPITAAVIASGEDLTTCGPPPYVVTVNRLEGEEVKPLEVTVVEEPAVEGADQLPPEAEEGGYATHPEVTGRPTEAFGSPSFTAAPVLEPGVYTDSILVSETLFYGVELDWGEQLVCEVEFGRSRPVNQSLGHRNPTATTTLHGPLHDEFFDPSQLTHDSRLFNASRPVTVWEATPPVRYRNREGSGVQPASRPGTYYCGAFLNGDAEHAAAGEVPIRVALSVVGTAGEGAPTYVEPEPSPSATPSADDGPAADDTAEASAPAEAGGVPLWAWLLGVLVALGLALAVLLRRGARR